MRSEHEKCSEGERVQMPMLDDSAHEFLLDVVELLLVYFCQPFEAFLDYFVVGHAG